MAEENRWALPALAILGLALRLFGAARAGLTFDESIVWAFAREITARPVHLVARTADHPLLNAYLVRASSLAFGESDFGLRILHVVGSRDDRRRLPPGSASWGARAGLLAAALVAVDPLSRELVAAHRGRGAAAALRGPGPRLALARSVSGKAPRLPGGGPVPRLAYLAKETALILLPALALGMLVSAQGRRALRTPGPWLGLLAALAIVGLDMWCSTLGETAHLDRALEIVRAPPGLTLKGTSLYLGELYRRIVGPDVLDPDYLEGNAFATHPALGMLYLVAVIAAWRPADEGARLLAAVFGTVFVAASVVEGAKAFDPFWWGALSFLPAVLLTGPAVRPGLGGIALVPRAAAAALVALALYDAFWLGRAGARAPRLSRQEWAARIAEDGEPASGRRRPRGRARAGEAGPHPRPGERCCWSRWSRLP